MAMPRTLSVATPNTASPVSSTITSPTEPESRSSSLSSPSPRQRFGSTHRTGLEDGNEVDVGLRLHNDPASPTITSLPPFPSSPNSTSKHLRDQSKSFFSNSKASKSSNKIHIIEPTIRQVSQDTTRSLRQPKESALYSLRKSPGSTPDLSKTKFANSSADASDGLSNPTIHISSSDSHRTDSDSQTPGRLPQRPVGTSIRSDTALVESNSRSKPRFAQLLTRTRSTRLDENGRRSKPPTPIQTNRPDDVQSMDIHDDSSLRSAPLPHNEDQSLRDTAGSTIRNRSADRQPPPNKQQQRQNQLGPMSRRNYYEPNQGATAPHSGSSREGTGTHLFHNIKNTSTRATDGIGKTGKAFFNKITRSGSSHSREAAEDEPYVCTTINLPLVEQTRRTRIAKKLEDSKDKTEFWMPALPWRCIDYLNFRGCEEEGLYRVPGSGRDVKEWQRRFDLEHDINLFDEPELYDINIIGSMFKAWLRDLPTEVLPKDTQIRIARDCAGAKEVPQMLKDELSMLPPWNYYLLFAITCHLSLLHAYVDKNKMNYNNLVICFQPCLRIDSFCFHFLVCDWRSCWQGCWTEKDALQQEYQLLDRLHSSEGDSSGGSIAVEERPTGSSQSSKAKVFGRSQDRNKPPPLSLTRPSEEHLHVSDINSSTQSRKNSQLPELAPMMPLSPIGLE